VSNHGNSKNWKRYSNAGGVGLGTLAVWSTKFIDSEFWIEFVTLISPTLTYISSRLFQKIDRLADFISFKLYIRQTKQNLKKQIEDPHTSTYKKEQLKKEYDNICQIEVDEYMNKIESFSATKKRK